MRSTGLHRRSCGKFTADAISLQPRSTSQMGHVRADFPCSYYDIWQHGVERGYSHFFIYFNDRKV